MRAQTLHSVSRHRHLLFQAGPAGRSVLVVVAQGCLQLLDVPCLGKVLLGDHPPGFPDTSGTFVLRRKQLVHLQRQLAVAVLNQLLGLRDLRAHFKRGLGNALTHDVADLGGKVIEARRIIQALEQILVELGLLDVLNELVHRYRGRASGTKIKDDLIVLGVFWLL
ncbi:hypothetical protein D3C71_1555540 [compost metagenome]